LLIFTQITRSALGLFCRSVTLRDGLQRKEESFDAYGGMTSQALLAVARVSFGAQVMP
jgi:hypothetical protein